MLRFQLAEPRSHPRDPPGVLAGRGGLQGRQDGGGERLGAHFLEGVGVGVGGRGRLEPGRFQVDEGPGHPLAHRQPERGDYPLTRVDRDVTEAVGPVGRLVVNRFDVQLRDDGNGRQPLDGRLHVLLERRWQRDGDAVIRAGQKLFADPNGKVARAVDDRQDPDAGADPEEVVGGRSFGHGPPFAGPRSSIVILIVRVRMQRVAGVEEEVAQAHRGVLASHRPALPPGEVFQVGGLLAEDAERGLLSRRHPGRGGGRGPGPCA